jgi:hypothetical protein
MRMAESANYWFYNLIIRVVSQFLIGGCVVVRGTGF